MTKFFYALRHCDRVLLIIAILLSAIGCIALYSVNLAISPDSFGLLIRQSLFLLFAVIVSGVLMTIDYRHWQPLYPWLYVLSVGILLIVFSPLGEVIRGTRSWLDFGFFVWQPIELIKVMIVISLAGYLCKQGRFLRHWRALLVSGISVAILVMLTLLQPDLGSAMILFLVWSSLMLLLGLSRWQMSVLLVGFSLIGIIGWGFVLRDYQKDRLMTFIDPQRDPLGTGYNLNQAIIATGSGGLFGEGIGFGTQSQLKFLPESQSDFIFSVIGEELGFAGVCLLLALFGVLAWRMMVIARDVPNDFGQILVSAIMITIIGQACVHIGINMGLLPVSGLSLPFISAGGSYLLAVWIMIGLVQSVAIHSR